jgi:hypothetical protein
VAPGAWPARRSPACSPRPLRRGAVPARSHLPRSAPRFPWPRRSPCGAHPPTTPPGARPAVPRRCSGSTRAHRPPARPARGRSPPTPRSTISAGPRRAGLAVRLVRARAGRNAPGGAGAAGAARPRQPGGDRDAGARGGAARPRTRIRPRVRARRAGAGGPHAGAPRHRALRRRAGRPPGRRGPPPAPPRVPAGRRRSARRARRIPPALAFGRFVDAGGSRALGLLETARTALAAAIRRRGRRFEGAGLDDLAVAGYRADLEPIAADSGICAVRFPRPTGAPHFPPVLDPPRPLRDAGRGRANPEPIAGCSTPGAASRSR